jgi:hypothetical protein
MALVLTPPIPEMSTTRYFWGLSETEIKADKVTAVYESIVQTMLDPLHLTRL